MTEALTVMDAARIMGVSPDTIRLWDRLGKLPATTRTRSGVRLFERADVERLARERSERHDDDHDESAPAEAQL